MVLSQASNTHESRDINWLTYPLLRLIHHGDANYEICRNNALVHSSDYVVQDQRAIDGRATCDAILQEED